MHRIVFLRLGGKNVHLPKLLGALLVFAAFLKILGAGADVFEATYNIKEVDNCLSSIGAEMRTLCQEQARLYFGEGSAIPRPTQNHLTFKQMATIVTAPMVALLWWFALLVVGLMVYKTGNVFIPVEEKDYFVKEPARARNKAARAEKKGLKR